jgi:hypothetical protein
MCAPRDQRKSSHNQSEQAELNALRCQRRDDVSGDCAPQAIIGEAGEGQNRRMCGYGMSAVEGIVLKKSFWASE